MKIRCIVKNEGGSYVAMSLDFGLAVQGDSIDDVKIKLLQQVEEYINEANREDVAYKEQLFSRKGPVGWFIRYYFAYFMSKLNFEFKEFSHFNIYQDV
jgi:hypothetical protein